MDRRQRTIDQPQILSVLRLLQQTLKLSKHMHFKNVQKYSDFKSEAKYGFSLKPRAFNPLKWLLESLITKP